jgi:hypothetical protein
MKAKIAHSTSGTVVLAYDPLTTLYGRVTREFIVCEGLVYELRKGHSLAYACRGLMHTGDTLRVPKGAELIDVIRREYRAMRATEKREAAKY